MKIFIHSLAKTLYDGEGSSVYLPAESGDITILDHHIPLVTALKNGTVRVTERESVKDFPVSGGFAEVTKDRVVLLLSE